MAARKRIFRGKNRYCLHLFSNTKSLSHNLNCAFAGPFFLLPAALVYSFMGERECCLDGSANGTFWKYLLVWKFSFSSSFGIGGGGGGKGGRGGEGGRLREPKTKSHSHNQMTISHKRILGENLLRAENFSSFIPLPPLPGGRISRERDGWMRKGAFLGAPSFLFW